MEFKIKHLTINDVSVAQQLFIVLQQVFGVEHPYVAEENHVKNLLENPSFVCFTVLTKNEIVGGLTAYEYLCIIQNLSSCLFMILLLNQNFSGWAWAGS